MEDEDGESKVGDMWNILEDQQIKDPAFDKSLKHSIDNVYSNVTEDEKHIIQYNSHTTKDSPSKLNTSGSKIVFKGFKKRILAQAQETQTVSSKSTAYEQDITYAAASVKNNKEKRVDVKRGKIAEYAQYLGLQPSSKNKCSKCHSLGNSCSSSKFNQCTCNSTMAPVQGLSNTSESCNLPHAANFKITRKVYLCAACGTYFENWNLFLHMRDIHKRHICLFCLGMFGQAERLSYHLSKKHSVPEMTFASVEDFYRVFKGSCYLVCCTCEKVFSETDNFYNHFCLPPSKQDASTSMCTLCRQVGTHANTCSLAVEANKDSQFSSFTTTPQTSGISTPTYGKPTITKSTSRKSKGNRNKHIDDDFNFYQQRLGALLKRTSNKSNEVKLTDQVPMDVTMAPTADNVHGELGKNTVRDTVSETIMEVSRYIGDSCSEEEEKEEVDNVSKEPDLEIRNKEKSKQETFVYDTASETVKEESRILDSNKTETVNKVATFPDEVSEMPDSSSLSSNTITEPRIQTDASVTPKLELDEQANLAEDRINEETPLEVDNAETASIRATSDPEEATDSFHSPVARSLFSPRHETVAPDIQPKEESFQTEPEQRNETDTVAHSPTPVSFNAVPSSDRSLVIKICANRNSQFSVSSGIAETVQTTEDAEVEENNNAEESTSSEKLAIISDEKEHRGQNAESDSDSDKLAVVDGNVDDVINGNADENVEATTNNEEVDEINTNSEPLNPAESDSTTNLNENENAIQTIYPNDNSDESGQIIEDATANTNNAVDETEENIDETESNDKIVLAGEDVPTVDLNVEGTLDSTGIEELLKRCIEAGSPFCVYCNHARHIAVNGKQLGLHMLAEHKFQPQHPAIIIHSDQFTARVKRSLDELESQYFNLDSYNSDNGTYNVPAVRTYECFHCRFHSAVHKELYLHNRKMHQKTILICIMCKSTFYSYSELLCHLCPGIYSPNINVKYRCCLCPVSNLPSAFRLMVHLRKKHHACDVCLESTGNQQRLSNHVWKHKLHHLCYRCNIAYRNKPDITKHLFWKHGTESVLCKKCLQKKWPHIYHFCIPPTAFGCEECGSSFSRAVALKVHKRLHSGDQPYACTECSERFISKKLLTKHENAHREPPVNVDDSIDVSDTLEYAKSSTFAEDESGLDREQIAQTQDAMRPCGSTDSSKEPVKDVPIKKVLDVYDLPPLNLSSESDTDDEDEEKKAEIKTTETKEIMESESEVTKKTEDALNIEGSTDIPTFESTLNEPEKQEEPISEEGHEEKVEKENVEEKKEQQPQHNNIVEVERNEEEKKQEAEIMDGIWDNFKTYTASLEPEESASSRQTIEETEARRELQFLRSVVQAEHDYCILDTEEEGKDPSSEKEADETPAEIATEPVAKEDNIDDDTTKTRRSPSTGSVAALNASCESDGNRKKTKSPKKKKQNTGSNSSSSDSSSDSDSSSCSCGTNCSCSSSSSGSSSSSSSSSDSDSSETENSPRKVNRKERKRKESTSERKSTPMDLDKQEVTPPPSQSPSPSPSPSPSQAQLQQQQQTIENGPVAQVPEEPVRTSPPKTCLLRESDLETDETETDEDFYDENPQQLANKLLAEKRNQLLLLASVVAPASNVESPPPMPLNNGVTYTNDSFPVTPSPDALSGFTAENTMEPRQTQQQKRKVKTKKRKKGERGRQRSQQRRTATPTVNTVESIKLNIPKAFYQKTTLSYAHPGRSTINDPHVVASTTSVIGQRTDILEQNSVQNETPADGTMNKRSSKRKRFPKRFYGDSSDEDTERQHQPAMKWRKVESPASFQIQSQPPPPPPPQVGVGGVTRPSFGGKSMAAAYRSRHNPQPSAASATESDAESSSGGGGGGGIGGGCGGGSCGDADGDETLRNPGGGVDVAVDSSDSELELDATGRKNLEMQQQIPRLSGATTNAVAPERAANLYCYCQCPYDEVSEMIACDGDDCRIEWFHFECVGIMVPPKGKWYCPDCRKKHGIVQNTEDYFD